MSKNIETLLADLHAKKIQFATVIAHIEKDYLHTPTAFKNGPVENEATQNQGSAKVFAFASLHKLSKEDTLLLFAEHYQAILDTPDGQDHQNIRQFMNYGWDGIRFEGEALQAK
ncbi:HopJ type III effector protein [Sphingobacterium bambusae]|uniref:HopJ type III effector protein n=1 Tax=Sphingobacterium bambusae TaxID=662858 RepID=A0ABW6BGN6_9SPHI|nr:HopJ type III effector protein [Sphingobacterium bambusae]WPL49727.1 HopJ type III effector protein [Sphingobacterium bambusae]